MQEGGIYFKGEDDLAECVRKLEAGEFNVKKMGECQARRIEKEYNWDYVARKYCELFSKLIMEK
ncbi:MAG: hypothetical protein DDT40_01423 [candidate division WS2 bacterium]|nr:hypothetical protein [Candidatus Psychracetigena formicireducens]